MKTIFSLLVLLGIIGGAAVYYLKYFAVEKPIVYDTAPIERGDILVTIGATGTLEPEDAINVGAQVAGRVESFGQDLANPDKRIDYNAEVQEGTVLANIDPTLYKAQVAQAEATLQRAKADLLQLHAKSEQTEQEWKRAEVLRPQQAIADTDYDLAKSNFHVARANVAVGEATKRQAEAALSIAQTNLDYTIIKSPVEGKIIARRVNVGQTVVSALNAPSLFLIAKDLRRMQVWASVNEADIGRIRLDMPARFTVDTFPGETFHGTVTQIRLNAEMKQNVVLYTVVVTTDNSSLKLLPYMTATVQFEVERRSKVLSAPNAALRWKPKSVSQIAPDASTKSNNDEEASEKSTGGAVEIRRIWTVDGNFVRPLDVAVGPTDGAKTEISGKGVNEGLRVVIGEGAGDSVAEADATTNPFLPKLPGGKKSSPPPPP